MPFNKLHFVLTKLLFRRPQISCSFVTRFVGLGLWGCGIVGVLGCDFVGLWVHVLCVWVCMFVGWGVFASVCVCLHVGVCL